MEQVLENLMKCKWYQFNRKRKLKVEVIIHCHINAVKIISELEKIRRCNENYNNAYHIRS